MEKGTSNSKRYQCGDDCKGECSGEVDGIPRCVHNRGVKIVRVYADWQPGYMGERAPTKQEDFKTMGEAKPTIQKWRLTACTVKVFEVEERVVATYIWGRKQEHK